MFSFANQSPYIEQKLELLEMQSPPDDVENNGYKSAIEEFATAAASSMGNIGHISMDVSRACTDLTRFLNTVQKESIERFHVGMRVLERPREMQIGGLLTELAFVSDADGTILELMRFIRTIDTEAG